MAFCTPSSFPDPDSFFSLPLELSSTDTFLFWISSYVDLLCCLSSKPGKISYCVPWLLFVLCSNQRELSTLFSISSEMTFSKTVFYKENLESFTQDYQKTPQHLFFMSLIKLILLQLPSFMTKKLCRSRSAPCRLSTAVPQSSVLGALMFSL